MSKLKTFWQSIRIFDRILFFLDAGVYLEIVENQNDLIDSHVRQHANYEKWLELKDEIIENRQSMIDIQGNIIDEMIKDGRAILGKLQSPYMIDGPYYMLTKTDVDAMTSKLEEWMKLSNRNTNVIEILDTIELGEYDND